MSFRRRITLVSAAAVAVAVVLASVLTYVLVSHQLHNQIDSQLRERAGVTSTLVREVAVPGVVLLRGRADRDRLFGGRGAGFGFGLVPSVAGGGSAAGAPGAPLGGGATGPTGPRNPFGQLPPRPNQVRGYQQLVNSSGRILFTSFGGPPLPVDAHTRSLARNGGKAFFRSARAGGVHVRILAVPLSAGLAVQWAQPLTDVDHLLNRLRLILLLIDIGGIALAALLGRLVAGAGVAPLKRLTQATEHVTRTQDLSRRIEPGSADELGRLAVSFNAMLDALEGSMEALDASVEAQRQLVADASHELRTPVTSLRTNVEILQQSDDVDATGRRLLLDDVVEQIEELTLLMNDLIELARGAAPTAEMEDVRLDVIAADAVDRARRHAPATPFDVALEDTIVAGVPARLDRAVTNLLDNAVKYSPPGRPVEVALSGGELTVRDHGPGIAAEDLPHVFDRFYRGAEARGRPGSGLGLAIVRQVADAHGARVSAEPAPGGGTVMRLRFARAEIGTSATAPMTEGVA